MVEITKVDVQKVAAGYRASKYIQNGPSDAITELAARNFPTRHCSLRPIPPRTHYIASSLKE